MSFAGSLIETARARSGLSQAALARRAGTSQSAIAMYEAGTRSPTLDTLDRIVRAAGFELRVRLDTIDAHDEALDRWLATLPPDARAGFERDQAARVAAGAR